MAHDIFICYESSDIDLAMEIYNFYQDNNYKCWIAPNDVKDSQNYIDEVLHAIIDSSMMFFISSEKSNNSSFCNKEIEVAFGNNIPILVFTIDDSIFDSSMEFYTQNQFFLKNQFFLDAGYDFPRDDLLGQALSIIGERSIESDGLSDGVSKQPGKASKSEIHEAGFSSVYLSYSMEDFSELVKFQNVGYEIAEGIEKSTVLVSFISKNSVKSCLDDIGKAFDVNIPVVLIYLEDVKIKFGLKFKIRYRSKINGLLSVDKLDIAGYVELLDGFGLKRDAVKSFESISSELGDANSFSYLNDLILSSRNVVLDSDIAFVGDFPERGIEIATDGMVIDGDGHTIDARGKSRMFDVRARNIVFKNIQFINGLNSLGGVINSFDSTITFENCKFKNNAADFNGGVIFQKNGIIKIVNCDFLDNSSNNMGGAFHVENGILEIVDCRIENSTSRYGGAIRSNESELTVTGSWICGCSSDYGGAINYNNGDITISGCCFKSNRASANGGAIETQNGVLNVDSTRFLYNDAKYGSAIRNHSQTILKKCRFLNESSLTGVIFNKKGSLEIDGCEFNSNVSQSDMIYNEDLLNLNNCIIRSNDVENVILNLANCGLSYCEFADNDCEYDFRNEKSANLFKSNFNEGNVLNESDLTLEDINGKSGFILNKGNVFIRNPNEDAESHIENYGEIECLNRSKDGFDFTYLDELINASNSKRITLTEDIICGRYERDFYEGGIVLDIEGMVIDGANHVIDGGGISRIFTVTALNVRLENIVFKNGFSAINDYKNPLNNNGGAIRNNSKSSLECINCRFIGNVSQDKGGAIDNRGGILSLSNCEFSSNSSEFLGGAIINRKGGKVNLIDSKLEGNASKHSGGAIENAGEIVLEKCSLSRNSSKEGGAIANRQDSLIYMCKFKNNEASGGGAIYNGRNATATINGSLFSENQAGNGGAIENRGLQLLIGECEFGGNSARDDGGAIYSFYCGMFLIENSILSQNTCGGLGGGIWNFKSNSLLEMANCELNDNRPDNIFND